MRVFWRVLVSCAADGKYLATGCNRTAQIFDTKMGMKTCVLVGDLCIRSVCFSPDGKFLAVGAEDKPIRIWDIAKKPSAWYSQATNKKSTPSTSPPTAASSSQSPATKPFEWDMVDGSSKVLTINDQDSISNDAGVTSVAMSPDGRFVAAGSLHSVVRIWDVATWV
ncbi:hypothetical protein HGRIS_011278 [Hohenbuehelia grisea]|uniref:Uncharacterized protein n=1 Tax=Hohenbuehelia grisea TaxID=104357 RepID=A0ABR3JUM2_9AGAR